MENFDKDWDAVSIDTVFDFERGKENNMASLNEGNTPLVSAKKMNNGVKGFVSNPKKIIKGGNVISLNNDGDGGAGLAYYQPMDFALDTHVTALHPKCDIPAEALLYMTASISKQHSVFGHGRSISLPRAKRLKNMLPVNNAREPDFEYMTSYTKSKRTIMQKKYRAYLEEQISELNGCTEVSSISNVDWHPFYISQIFTEIERGKRLKKADQTQGKVPYVSSTALNNGVDGFIEASSGTRVFGNCISLANSGSVGSAFYEPFDFVASDHVTHLKNESFSKWVYLFLTVAIEKQKGNFNFNREINDTRIRNMKIMLPVCDNGTPDFEYMEQYAKDLMLKKYKQYRAFLETKDKGARVQASQMQQR